MIKHILFPFDFSNQARLAIPFVRAIANRFGSTVTLIGVVQPARSGPASEIVTVVEAEAVEQERDLKSRLEQTLNKEFSGLTARSLSVSGDSAFKIVEYAHSHKIDLIMTPTHGLGIFRSMLLGSVTAKILHDAKTPVWTATHSEEQNAPAEPRTILCCVDAASDKALALLRWAHEFSKGVGANLKLLHVVPPISDWLSIPSERELQEELRTEARAQIESCIQQVAGLDADLRVQVGGITETVAEEARQEGVDLVVIGRGSIQAPLGRLRSHAYAIIQQSPCPVLSV